MAQRRKKLIKNLADTGKLLSDLHHEISMTRRSFIIKSLNPTAKKVAEESPLDMLLFGNEYNERLKSAILSEKEGKQMTRSFTQNSQKLGNYKPKSSVYQPSRSNFQKQNNLNSKAPSRKGNVRSSNSTGAKRSQSSRSNHRQKH